jgi:hypothetical protein
MTLVKPRALPLILKKSQILFFNTHHAIQAFITHILGFSWSSLPSKYIGISLIENFLLNEFWEGLLATIDKHLNSWTFCTLNIVGHLVLLKFVPQDILIYIFSSLAAPKPVIKTIKKL